MTGKEKFHKVMSEFSDGTLLSHGKHVHDRKQAIAIAYSEARKEEPSFGKNPISLNDLKDLIKLINKSPDLNAAGIEYITEGYSKELIERVIKLNKEGKSPEEIWEEIHFKEKESFKIKESESEDKKGWHFTNHKNITSALYKTKQDAEKALTKYLDTGHLDIYGNAEVETKENKLKKAMKSKDKSKLKDKDITNEIKEEEKAKNQLDMEQSFVEDRDKFISLNEKGYFNLAVAEVKEYGVKMPFGHLRKMGSHHVFFYSEKLEGLLDKYKIHHTILESKKELLEYIEKL